jgi:hypothetical protein
LERWISERNLPASQNADVLANDLMTELGIDDYIEPISRCNIDSSPYKETTRGWNNGR